MPVDVAVTLILKDNSILLVYNEKWGAFTLPMTKRRRPEGAESADESLWEPWQDAAARPVVECLGRLSSPKQVLDDFLPESHFSLRRQTQVIFRYKVFKVLFEARDKIVAKTPTVWLTASEILKGDLHPISPTAIDIIKYKDILESLGFQT